MRASFFKKFLLIFLVASTYAVSSCAQEEAPVNQKELSLVIESADGTKHPYMIELALTQQEMTRGLMFRREMEAGHGMLFVFGDDAERAFWMENTYLPLDLIFIKKDGIIHHIHPNAVPLDRSALPSKGPVRAVLEVNAGDAKLLGLAPGDIVHHSAFGNRLAE